MCSRDGMDVLHGREFTTTMVSERFQKGQDIYLKFYEKFSERAKNRIF
jgi:hypothetical protein